MSWPTSQRRWRGCCPVVIGGCARSGTTLLLSVLSSHPRICAIPFETQALCPTAYWPEPRRNATLDAEIIRNHLLSTAVPPDCRYWCEKTPKNVLFFGQILRHFGRTARLIHMVRDGRDVVCSIHPDDPTRCWVSPPRWVKDVAAGLAFEQHRQVLTVRYEDLVSRFHATIHGVCEFLELDMTYHLEEYPAHATVKTSNAWFDPARVPTPSSVGKWRTESCRERVDELMANADAVKLLHHFNYL
ncbi:MAG: sulfotransferase [Pirellulaceae bacterium]|nr:sulfotransferase [Pirellulaceae bacterium]